MTDQKIERSYLSILEERMLATGCTEPIAIAFCAATRRRSRAASRPAPWAMRWQRFPDGDGIAAGDAEKTIANVGRLASEGMRQTDRTILAIVTE